MSTMYQQFLSLVLFASYHIIIYRSVFWNFENMNCTQVDDTKQMIALLSGPHNNESVLDRVNDINIAVSANLFDLSTSENDRNGSAKGSYKAMNRPDSEMNEDWLEATGNRMISWIKFCFIADDAALHLIPMISQIFDKEIGASSHVHIVLLLRSSDSVHTARKLFSRSDNRTPSQLQILRNRTLAGCPFPSRQEGPISNGPGAPPSCADAQRALDLAGALQQCAAAGDSLASTGTAAGPAAAGSAVAAAVPEWVVLSTSGAAVAPCPGAVDRLVTLLLLMAERPAAWRAALLSASLQNWTAPIHSPSADG